MSLLDETMIKYGLPSCGQPIRSLKILNEDGYDRK
jgi:hypothetical protein